MVKKDVDIDQITNDQYNSQIFKMNIFKTMSKSLVKQGKILKKIEYFSKYFSCCKNTLYNRDNKNYRLHVQSNYTY